jgi:hypothetical protein
MNKSAFALMTSTVMILAACALKPGGEVVTYYPKPMDQNGITIEHKEITLFDLGRTMSHNAVDIFDPSLASFAIPPDDPKAANPLAAFSADPFMLIKDDDVTVFSMFSSDTSPSAEIISPPLPITIDESQLPP